MNLNPSDAKFIDTWDYNNEIGPTSIIRVVNQVHSDIYNSLGHISSKKLIASEEVMDLLLRTSINDIDAIFQIDVNRDAGHGIFIIANNEEEEAIGYIEVLNFRNIFE